MDERLIKLYNNVGRKYNLGTFDEFQQRMQNEEDRIKFYNNVGQVFALGSYDEFSSIVAPATANKVSAPSAPSAEEIAEEMQPQGAEVKQSRKTSLFGPPPAPKKAQEEDSLPQYDEVAREQMRQHLEDSGTIERMEEMEKEARKAKRKERRQAGLMAMAAAESFSAGAPSTSVFSDLAQEHAKEWSQNKVMEQTLDVALDKARAGEWGGIGENNVGNGVVDFGLGLWDSATRMSTWDFGVSDALNGLTIAQVVKKWEEGPESLTATERNLLDAMGMATAVQEAYQDQVGIGYAVGESLPQSAGFMASMYLNPASGMGKTLARQAVKKYGRQSIAKNLARIGGDIAETAIMTATTGGGRVVADALDRINGHSVYDIDPETGIVMYGGQEDQKTVGEAVVKTIGSNFIENYSEALGEYFDPLLGMSRRLAAGGLKKMNLNKWADALSDVQPSQMAASIRSLRERAKFGGVFGEIMEEEVGMALNAVSVGDYTFSKEEADKEGKQWIFDLETQLTTALSCAIMSGAITGYETIGNVRYRREMEKDVSNAEKAARAAVGDETIELIDQASPESMVDILRDAYMDQNLSLQQKRILAEYATKRVRMQYYNAADAKARRQVNVEQQNALDAYEAGRHAQLPQYYNIDQEYRNAEAAINERENAEEIWDAIRLMNNMDENERQNIMRDFSEEDQELIRNWRYNAYRWQGAINHRAEQIEDLVDEFAGQVNPYVVEDEQGNRNVTTAVYGDNVVYVMAQNADGATTIVTNDGRKKMVNANELEHVQTRNADELIDRFRQQTTEVVNQETEKNLSYPSEVLEPAEGVTVETLDGKQWQVAATDGENVEIVGLVFDKKSGQWIPNSGDYRKMTREQFMDWQKAELDRKRANTYEQGDELTFYVNGEPISAEITGIDPEGNYYVHVSNLVEGLDKAVSDVYTAEELRKLTTPSSKVSENITENESASTEEINQSVSEEVANGQNIAPEADAPQTSENIVGQATENVEAPTENETALSRVPLNDKGEPMYEAVDADTAWDAIMEQTEGNVDMAQRIAEEMVADKKAALAKMQKGKPKKGATVAEKIANEKAHNAAIAQAEADVKAWELIASVNARRVQAEELARAEAEKAANEARKAEEARILAEQEEQARREREELQGVPDMVDDTPQDARARGYRRVNGHKVERQGVLPSLQGKEVGVKFSNDVIANGRVAVIEAEQLQPSHLQGVRNPAHFIDEAQPKERNDEASVASARKIAANIRPEEITSSVTAYTGAPTVNMRGEAIQGNSRSDALRVMWAEQAEQAAKYKQYLIDHAEEFGLNAEEIAAMEHPVLVNMLDVSDTDAINLGQYVAQDTESGGNERIKAKNVARKMGKDIRSFANILLNSSEEEMSFSELVDKNGVEVLKWMNTKGYITPTQYASAFDSKGNLTAEAKNDLRGILYQSIFQGGNTQLEEQFNALPAKAQKAILATAYRDYDSPNTERMVGEIQSSIRAFYALSHDKDFVNAKNYKDAKEAMLAWSRQYQMDDVTGESFLPSENFSNFALELAVVYKGWTQTNIQSHFNNVYDLVQGTKEASLFEEADNTPRTLADAIKETFNIEYNGQLNSNSLAVDSQDGQAGERGSDGDTASGERAESGEGSADSGRGTDAAREQGEVDGKRKVTANVFEMAEEAQKKRKDALKTKYYGQGDSSILEGSNQEGGTERYGSLNTSDRGELGTVLKSTDSSGRRGGRGSESEARDSEGMVAASSDNRRVAVDNIPLRNLKNHIRRLQGAIYAIDNTEKVQGINEELSTKREDYKKELSYAKEVLAKKEGNKWGVEDLQPISLATAEDMFNEWNDDADVRALFDRVFEVFKQFGIDIVFDDSYKVGEKKAVINLTENLIRLPMHSVYSDSISNQDKANLMLHEMIHGVTSYVLHAYEEGPEYRERKGVSLSDGMMEAARQLNEIHRIITRDKRFYGKQGVKDVHEMVSELSDPEFRALLKETTIWDKIVNALKQLLGIDVENNALDGASKALDYILDNADVELYNIIANRLEPQAYGESEENLRFREKEELKELIAVHNISEDNLKKVLEAGSLIMPSIAITKADMGHDSFGEISLLFDKSTINPSDRRNKVYGGDAWTPRFPEVRVKVDSDVVKRVREVIYDAIKDERLRSTYSISAELHPSNVEDTISKYGIDSYYRQEWMKLAYLLANGKRVKIPMRKKSYGYGTERIYELIRDRGFSVRDIYNDSESFYDNNPDFVAEVKDIVNEAKLANAPVEKRDELRATLESKPFRFMLFDLYIGQALHMEDDIKSGSPKEILDKQALRDLVEKKVKTDNADYNKWVDNLFEGIVEKRGIRNNRELYTPSGNHRSWEQLYDPATPANILKHMLAVNEQGGSGGLFDSNIMGASAETYESIEEIREKGKQRLKKLPYEEYDEWSESVGDRMSDIVDDFLTERDKAKFGSSIDAKIEITKAVANDKTAKGIYKHMKREYPNFTMEHAKQVEEIVKEIQEFATGYFEAKPQRLVSVNEVMAAVVPSNASKEIVDALKSNGIEVITYKKGDEEARKRVVERVSSSMDIRFRDGAPFFSNAERSVENIKQNKATPEQWLAMIKKDGGLKAGEDKWMGLSDWLNEQKEKGVKSLTKDEVLAFIRENQIEIEEVNYAQRHDYGDDEDYNAIAEEIDDAWDDYVYDAQRGIASYGQYEELDDVPMEQVQYHVREKIKDVYGDDIFDHIEIDENGNVFVLGNTKPINSTRLEYTTEGLDNKKEIALVVPTIESWNQSDNIHFGDAGEGRAVAWVRFGETTTPREEKYVREVKLGEPYKNFSGDNVYPSTESKKDYIVHKTLRDGTKKFVPQVNERPIGDTMETAAFDTLEEAKEAMSAYYKEHPLTKVVNERVLVIDEVQSKRHDEGRAKGYKSNARLKELEREYDALIGEQVELTKEILHDAGYAHKSESEGVYNETMQLKAETGLIGTDEQRARYNDLSNKLYEVSSEQRKLRNSIPDAPFDKNYHELVMKRMLRYAAENGFDKVAWTKGEQQAERYGLNKVVDAIDASNFSSDTERDVRLTYTNEQQDNLLVRMSDGVVVKGDINGSSVEGQKLSDIIGKDAADELLSTTDDMEIKGDGLNFGGEDRNALYDEMIPRFMNKYTKKWGTKVGEVTLPEVEEAGRTMWSVDVTPEMRESVMQGQPMFREGMGAISDREVSYENDPIAKWQGKPRYYGKRAAAFADRERIRMENAAKEASEMLGIEAEIITDTSTLQGRKAKAKGWYDIINKKVVVVVPNHVSIGDAVRTVLHEGVAHHGLRELFGDGFDAMLDNIYNNVAPELKARIDAIAERTGVSTSVATEEYLASLAEETNFEEAKNMGWWAKIKQYFAKMLNKLGMPGLNLKEEITDNELRYLLWRSYQNLVDPNSYLKPLGYLDDVAKQKELKVGNYAENTMATPRAAEMSEAEEWAEVTMQRIDELEAQAAQLENEIADMEAKREADDASRYDMWGGLMMPLQMQLEDVYAEIEGLYTLSGEEEIDEEGREAEKQRQLYQKRIDNAYLKAVREGDWEEATDLFRQYVLSKAEDEGIVPMDYGVGYRGGAHSSIAKKVKEENPDAIAEAAYQMSIRIPKGSILVPMPSRTGNATYTVKLAEAIAKATDSEVRDVLKGKARMSVYEAKQKGIKMTPEDLGMYTTEELPKGKNIVIIDNVIDKGTTALAAVSAVKGASVVAYAYTLGDKQRAATLKLAEPVTYDDNKRIIPLSQRFDKETDDIRYRLVDDQAEIDRLENEPTIKAYRAMQVINGELYPPMSAVVDGKLREPIALGQWERSEERPELADDDGNFKLNKGNKKSPVPARYNPYFHSSATPLNDQFAEAQDRPNLVTVEVEIPQSEADGTSGYKAEKAKDAVGAHQWKAGAIQGQISGTRTLYLSRWDKPVRIVPDSEVAVVIAKMLEGTGIVMPSNVVTPSLRAELEKLGVPFVETTNSGKLAEGEHKGEGYGKVYGKKADGLRYRAIGGNKGYVGYSMSKRASQARDEGRFPKIDFKKEYGINDKVLDALVKLGIINNTEWHHTSKFGNRTPFYGWEEVSYADYYEQHREEIDQRVKAGETDGLVDDFEAYEEEQERLRKERSTNDMKLTREYGQYREENAPTIPDEYNASNGVKVVTNGSSKHSDWRYYWGENEAFKKYARAAESELSDKLRAEDSRMSFTEWKAKRNSAEIIAEVERESAALGVPVRIVRSVDELPDEDTRKRAADGQLKGYFDPRTGEVALYEPNTDDANDAKRTILHEIVGHKGLRQLIGEERYDKAMVQLMYMLPSEVRDAVLRRAERHGWNAAIAMDEYLADQAERDVQPTWWGKVNAKIRALLRNMGFNVMLTDADVTYLLWRSRKKLMGDTAFDMATNAILKQAARKSVNYDAESDNAIRHRGIEQGKKISEAVSDYYEKYTATTNSDTFWGGVKYMATHLGDGGTRALLNDFSESQFEDIRSVRVLEEAIESAEGKPLRENEMVHKSLNAKTSRDARDMDKSQTRFFQPMAKLLGKVLGKKIDGRKIEIDDVERYLICKHSPENNEFLMKRAHAENRRKKIHERAKELMKGTMTEEEAIAQATSEYTLHQSDFRDDYSGLTELFPDDMVREAKITERTEELTSNGVDEVTARQMASREFESYEPTLEDREKMAADEVARFEAAVDGLHEELWGIINGINRDTIERLFRSGLISRSLYNDLKKRHKFYVPLSGWKNDAAADIYNYAMYGFDGTPIQTVIKKAFGTKYQARNILGSMFAMNMAAITEGNQNLVKQKLYNLALNHDTGVLQIVDLWEVKDGEGDAAEWKPAPKPELRPTMSDAEMQKALTDYQNKLMEMKKDGKARKAVNSLADNFGKHTTDKEAKRHHVELLVNGRKVVIWVNGNPKLAQAINGDLKVKKELLFFNNAVDKANRFLAQVQTSLNPEFMISNFERDILSASRYNLIKYGPKYEASFMKHLAQLMPIVSETNADMRSDVWGGAGIFNLFALDRNTNNPNRKPDAQVLDMNNPLHREFVNFLNYGGKTGYVERKQAEDLQQRIKKLSEREQSIIRKVPAEVAGWAVDTIEQLNEGIENATRFAAYLAARERGKSVTEAVFEAKEVSVNFNMQGSGAWGNASYRKLYNYFNVGLQSLRREKNLGREFPKAYIANLAFMMALGAISTALLTADWDGDDEDEYMGLSDFNRYNYINVKTENGFIHYSLPQDLRAFYAIGCISTEWAMGKIDGSRAMQAYATQANNYTPLSFVSTTIDREPDSSPLKNLAMSFVPSFAKPVAEIAVNEDFLGRRIHNQNQWNEYEPEWQRAGYRTPEWVINASKTLSEAGGGTEHKRGVWFTEINPSNAWHIMDSYGGGFLDFAQKTYNLVEREFAGKEYELRDYPMVSKFYVESGQDYSKQRVVNDRYRMYREDYETINNELNGYLKDKSNALGKLSVRAEEEGLPESVVNKERSEIEKVYEDNVKRVKESPNYWIYESFVPYEKGYNNLDRNLGKARKYGSEQTEKELSGEMYNVRKKLVDEIDAKRERPIDRVRQWLGN